MMIEEILFGVSISFSLTPFYYIFVEILDGFYQAFRNDPLEE